VYLEEDKKVKLNTVDKVLDFAIEKEEDAAQFYSDLAAKVTKKNLKEIFEQFAVEEKSHKAKLQEVKKGNLNLSSTNQKIMDLKIVDVLIDVDPDADLDYQQALIVAMKAEKASFKLYNDLAAISDDPGIKKIFLGLAQEEAKHKLRFEIEYDETVLKDN
jgi:rubrerythrin